MTQLYNKAILTGKLIMTLLLVATIFVSCDDMLFSDSKRLTTADEYNLKASADSVYSMAGVYSRLQKLGDSYVLLGELRADLMDLGKKSDPSLVQIDNFEITKDNQYVNIKNYYDVINNCNYIIQKLDTSYLDRGKKLQLREYGELKAIRAWTYMQIALNFKTAKYYEYPILTVQDAQKEIPSLELKDLADKLIVDLEPLKNVTYMNLNFGSIFMVNAVLGDLYLWRGSLTNNKADYENAATAYHKLMFDYGLDINKGFASTWAVVNKAISTDATLNWIMSLTGEAITTIDCPTEYGQKFALDTLNNRRSIIPSELALNVWDNQTYYLNDGATTTGDLRKYGSISYSEATNKEYQTDLTFKQSTTDNWLIYKYKWYDQNIILYRSSLLYLRYAEAVNRLNKPNLAFAVLKYGLKKTTFDKKIPFTEQGTPLPTYMDFTDKRFDYSVGIRMRGLGNLDQDSTYFVIPNKPAMADSVLYVEDKLLEELQLETAFDGNRFHDLMRFTLRRMNTGEGTTSFLADKIAEKHKDNKEAIRAKLTQSIDNWYIKTEK
jgi:hypothetical protein